MNQKGILMIALTAAAALYAGCVKDEEEVQVEEGKMQLVVEPKQSDDKAMVRGTSVRWNPSGETLLVNGLRYNVAVRNEGNVAEVEVAPSATGYKCVYPASYPNGCYYSYEYDDMVDGNTTMPVPCNSHMTNDNYQFNYPKVYQSYSMTVSGNEWQTIPCRRRGTQNVMQPLQRRLALGGITTSEGCTGWEVIRVPV